MNINKRRIETNKAPASTGFRSQGLVAGGILFTGGQIGAEMLEAGVLRKPCSEMKTAVRATMNHLEQVTLAAGCKKQDVFEVSAFPKLQNQQGLIFKEVKEYLGFEPILFNHCEVFDTADHALIEMDWMTIADTDLELKQAAEFLHPLGNKIENKVIESGPFLIWNKLVGDGSDLGAASEALLADLKVRLESMGGSLENLLKLTVYIKEFEPYPLFNNVTKRIFADIIPPTRSVLVAPNITGGAHICIDVVAMRADSNG